jgi:hypothetical protein
MNAPAISPALPARRRQVFRFHLPVMLLWLLLLPFAPLLLLVLCVVCAVYVVNPLRAAAALLQSLAGLKGIHIEVHSREISFVFSLF